MIRLNEHIVEIEGKQYIPLDIAVKATIEAMNAGQKLTEALKDFNQEYTDLQDD